MKIFVLSLTVILFCLLSVFFGNQLFYQPIDEITAYEEMLQATQIVTLTRENTISSIEEIVEESVEEKIEIEQVILREKYIAPEEEIVEKTYELNEKEVTMLSKLVWGEAMGLNKLEQSAVIWCVLNRVDSQSRLFPDTIKEVILQPNQFSGYHKWCPVREDIEELVRDVLTRWYMEKDGVEDVGRTLPKDYLYFRGFSKHNWFFTTAEYHKAKNERNYWDWSLGNPYE